MAQKKPASRKLRRPVMRWFGGKYRLADWIISHMPEHSVYCEPFGGAGSVLMNKPRSRAEVYNDLDDSAYNLFCVLRDRGEELKRLLEHTPYSRREFELAHVYHPCPVESAKRLIVRSFMGFCADSASRIESATGFRSNSIRSNTSPSRDWMNYPECVLSFRDRLRGVVIENRSAFDVMREQDSPETLHYVDPPYPHSCRKGGRYMWEMGDEDHSELMSMLRQLKGMVMVSGYLGTIYDQLGWRMVTKNTYADGAKKTTEALWMNFNSKDANG